LILPIKIEFIWAKQCLEINLTIAYSIFVSAYRMTIISALTYTYENTMAGNAINDRHISNLITYFALIAK